MESGNIQFLNYPYNEIFLFQENKGAIDTLRTEEAIATSGTFVTVITIPDPAKGKLIFPRTRKKSGYQNLPGYNCVNYRFFYSRLLVKASDAAVLDQQVRILDTLTEAATKYYEIRDTLLFSANPNYYNLEVDFLVSNGQSFEKFDWAKEFCDLGYNGRMPLCNGNCGPFKGRLFSLKHGDITYNMVSVGFKRLFGNKKMKLRFQIKDRALHKSNTVETPEFTL
jgi:hypothetical protein